MGTEQGIRQRPGILRRIHQQGRSSPSPEQQQVNHQPGATRATPTNQPKAANMHQHQQTYRPAPAPSTGAAVAAALATIALFALIGAMLTA